MNVEIFWACAMECMGAQTRPWFILSSERVFLGNGVRTHVNSKEISPLLEKIFSEEDQTCCIKQDSEPNRLPMSYFSPCFSADLQAPLLNLWPSLIQPDSTPSVECLTQEFWCKTPPPLLFETKTKKGGGGNLQVLVLMLMVTPSCLHSPPGCERWSVFTTAVWKVITWASETGENHLPTSEWTHGEGFSPRLYLLVQFVV